MSCDPTPDDAKPGHYIMARDAYSYLRYPGEHAMIAEALPREFIDRHLRLGDRFKFTDKMQGNERVMKFYEIERWGDWEATA